MSGTDSPSPEPPQDIIPTRDITETFVDKEKSHKFYTDGLHRNTDDELELVPETAQVLTKKGIFLLNLAWYGLSLMFLLLSVEVIPAQIQSLVGPTAKGRWLGGMVACGAGVTFIVSPLIGMQSDRSSFKFGKRRPVMFLGTIALCIGLVGMAISSPELSLAQMSRGVIKNETGKLQEMQCNKDLVALRCAPYLNESSTNLLKDNEDGAQQPNSVVLQHNAFADGEKVENMPNGNLALYIVFYLILTTAFAGITVPYNALIADKSHPSQRGLNSGVMAAMILIGNVSGAAVGTSFTQIGVIGAYSISIAIVVITLIITIFSTHEECGKTIPDPIGCFTLFCGFWDPLKEHDFRWVFITRFLMQQGVSTVTGFLEYWLHDMAYLPNCWTAATSVAIMLLHMLFAAACSSIVFGIISDKIKRRKPIVIIAATVMSVCMSVLVIVSGKSAFYVGIFTAFFFGIGFGSFQSVDFALVMDVLPKEKDKAKDIAVWHQALILPNALATPVGGIGFGSFQSVDFALVMDVLPKEKDKAKDIAVWHQALILPNALATPVGGIIVDYFQSVDCRIGLGYIILFIVTGVYFCLSGIFVTRIRNAK